MTNHEKAPQSDETPPLTAEDWMVELRRNGSLGGLRAQVQTLFDSCQTLEAVEATIPKARGRTREWFDAYNISLKPGRRLPDDELDSYKRQFERNDINRLAGEAQERIRRQTAGEGE